MSTRHRAAKPLTMRERRRLQDAAEFREQFSLFRHLERFNKLMPRARRLFRKSLTAKAKGLTGEPVNKSREYQNMDREVR